MKTIALLFALLASLGAQQVVNQPTVFLAGDPPGGIGAACSTPPIIGFLDSTGDVITCQGGTWAVVSGGGGGGSPTGPAGGNLGGTYPNPIVIKVNGVVYGATPGTNTVPVVTSSNTVTYEAVPNAALANPATTVNGQTCTLGSTCTITGAPSGSASGDLSGSYPGPTVAKVNGNTPGGTCTNQFARTIDSSGRPTCATVANADLANPATTVAGKTCTLGSTCSIASTDLSNGTTVMTTTTPPLEVSASVTLYLCPSSATNCAYNGDGGQSATPSDSCTFTTAQAKATPCTPTGLAALFANIRTSGASIPQIQFADAYASTTPACYQLSALTISTGALQGGTPTDIYQTLTNGANAVSAAFPASYIYFHGNDSNPAHVLITGSSTCSGTTVDTARAFVVDNAVARFSGMKLQYYGVGAPSPRGTGAIDAHHSILYVDNLVGQGLGSSNTGCMISAIQQSYLQIGGTNVVTDWCAFVLTGSQGQFSSPAGPTVFTYSSNSWANQVIHVQEQSHLRMDVGTYSFTGSGAYTIWSTQQRGQIFWGDINTGSKVVKFTLNAANATWALGNISGIVNVPCDNNLTQIQCTSDGNVLGGGNAPVYKIRANAQYSSFLTLAQMAAGTTADTNKASVICTGAFPGTCNLGSDTINSVTITAPSSSATLTIANGKTATVNNSITLAGTDSTTMTFPSTSASIARTDAAQTFTGNQTIPTVNKVTITAPASGSTLTIPDGVTLTGPASSGTAMTLGNTETVTGDKTFTGAVDASGASSIKVKVSAGYAPTADGQLGYDSTAKRIVGSVDGVSKFIAAQSLTPSFPNSDTVNCTSANGVFTAFANSQTLPANYFDRIGKAVDLHWGYKLIAPGSPSATNVQWEMDSTAVYTAVATTTPTASVTTWGGMTITVIAQTIGVSGTLIFMNPASQGGGGIAANSSTVQPITFDTTASHTLTPMLKCAAATGSESATSIVFDPIERN